MIRRVLLCCRGEIALRFIRTCRLLGVETAVLFTDDDKGADFVLAANHRTLIPDWNPARLMETTLSTAVAIGADAIVPGYGALAENAQFAAASRQAGLLFVGPNTEAIRHSGDKIAARVAAQAAGVAVIPGAPLPSSVDAAAEVAAALGFPILIKAAMGGGGRGIRIVTDAGQFSTLFEEVRREATLAFGSGELYIEKFLGERIRHIEVQILGDSHGNLLHLGTRACSAQRRRQKIVEEAPAPGLPDPLRDQLHAAALAVAREIGYDSAGTVEFLVDAWDRFYFIEMNARIQVEHPVTEEITDVDIVEQMLLAASGQPLSVVQESIDFKGHAVEFRLCAEDAHAEFLPSGGRVTDYRIPEGPGLRIDAGIQAGSLQSARFDSLCLKLIVHGRRREEALRRAALAFDELVVAGFSTNQPVHRWLLQQADFQQGHYDLAVLTRFPDAQALPAETAKVMHAAVALARHLNLSPTRSGEVRAESDRHRSPWVVRNSLWPATS